MSWLLDTHVWVWSVLEPERLGGKTLAVLEDPEQTLYVATVSTLELARLVHGGRLELSVGVDEWVDASLSALSAITLELTHRVAASVYASPEPFHCDPEDRMLVATAREHDLVPMTADERILEYSHVRSHDARR